MEAKDNLLRFDARGVKQHYENQQRERWINIGRKEVVEFKCEECSTPDFAHLIIPKAQLKKWGIE